MRAETRQAIDEWAAEVDRHKSEISTDPGALTIRQLAARFDRSTVWAQNYINKELAAGRVVRLMKRVNNRLAPAYKRVHKP